MTRRADARTTRGELVAEGRRDVILRQIDDLIDLLDQPLRSEDEAAGWSPVARAHFLPFFRRLRVLVARDERLPPEAWNLAPHLNYFGILDGELLLRALRVSHAISDARERG